MATLLFWGLAVLPGQLWVELFCRNAGSVLAGAALGAAAYLVGGLAEKQWQPLAGATLQLVHGLLRLAFSDTVCLPGQGLVDTPSYQVKIAPACSGYEGVGLIAALFAVVLWAFRRDFRFPRAYALVPVAMALCGWPMRSGSRCSLPLAPSDIGRSRSPGSIRWRVGCSSS
jgi:hypothetical protein